ncbi:MAG: kinase/pyrophosphorylase, partial [Stellaceae bacterium]
MNRFHLHLVSDSTGDTVHAVAKACLAQFDEAEAIEHSWMMVRSDAQLERVIAGIVAHPGLVLYTMVDDELRRGLEDGCRQNQIVAIPVLDPVMNAIGTYLGAASRGLPGQQHLLDAEYFRRVDAMTYALAH